MGEHERLSRGEELANSLTHGAGAVLGVAALVAMVVYASLHGDAWKIVSSAIFGASLVILYIASTLYHAFPPGRARRFFLVLDHSAIYLLIAGTYTPFTLVTIRGAWGWTLFGIVWGLAVCGVVFKCFFAHRFQVLSTIAYVLMGWCAVFVIVPLLRALPWSGFLWLLAGGLSYTAGVNFFASTRRYAHTVWHLFVLCGSLCHFYAVWRYVL